MADVQLENGYSKIANEILESIAKYPINGTQHRIVDIVWRYTYGFNRKEHGLSETFIAKATNIHRKQIQRELNVLISCNILRVIKAATFSSPRTLAFNKDYNGWVVANKLPGSKKEDTSSKIPRNELEAHTGSGLVPSPGSGLVPQERKYLKKTIKKDFSLEIENFKQRYSDFLDLIIEYFDILRTTRVSGKISDSIIHQVYTEMKKYPVVVVKSACITVISNPNLHSKRENYFYGIMRNTKADEAAEKIRKYEAAQTEERKPNEEYLKLKESLSNGSTGI